MIALVVGVITVAALGEAILLVGLFFLAGVVGWLMGFPLLGIASLRANVFPAWVGWLLIVFIPAIAVLLRLFESFGVGAASVALMWLAIGCMHCGHTSGRVRALMSRRLERNRREEVRLRGDSIGVTQVSSRKDVSMRLEQLARWAVPGALLMAGAWFAAGIVAWALPGGQDLGDVGSTRFFLIEGLHSIGEFGLLAAIAGLYVFQRKSFGRLGKIGTWVAFVGTAVLLASTLLWLAFAAAGGEGNLLTGLIFMAGILGWLVGFPILGIAMLRAGEMPVWTGVLVLIFIPVALGTHLALNSYGVGGVAVGLIWLAIGYGLWAQRTAPVYRQATV